MATINNMVGTGNLSLFNNYSRVSNQNAARNSLNALWQNYGNFNNNSLNILSGFNEIKTNASAVMDSYDNAKQAFYAEFDDNMNALRNSASAVKNLNLSNTDFGENPITTTESVDKDGNKTTTTTYSKPLQDALDSIKNLVNNYNDTINFLHDNSEVSARVSRMAQNFGDTTYRASNYESIGITVGKNGALNLDEEKLAKAITENPSRVEGVLGRDELADKATQHVDTANSQRDRLFPTAKSMLGNQLDFAALYTGRAFVNMTAISNIGNLVNMML